ncbi:MAG: hypothetical protein R3Y13_02840 [bacterium]
MDNDIVKNTGKFIYIVLCIILLMIILTLIYFGQGYVPLLILIVLSIINKKNNYKKQIVVLFLVLVICIVGSVSRDLTGKEKDNLLLYLNEKYNENFEIVESKIKIERRPKTNSSGGLSIMNFNYKMFSYDNIIAEIVSEDGVEFSVTASDGVYKDDYETIMLEQEINNIIENKYTPIIHEHYSNYEYTFNYSLTNFSKTGVEIRINIYKDVIKSDEITILNNIYANFIAAGLNDEITIIYNSGDEQYYYEIPDLRWR